MSQMEGRRNKITLHDKFLWGWKNQFCVNIRGSSVIMFRWERRGSNKLNSKNYTDLILEKGYGSVT